jgi:two-component system nitrate/nitrite response regulator NarL
MTNQTAAQRITVICVDDNPLVTEALGLQLRDYDDIELIGRAASADELIAKAGQRCPSIVLLDYDMPGKSPFQAISELEEICSESRVLMYSGHVHEDLVDCALEAGAWGYVAKVDPTEDLIAAIRRVAAGSFAFSPAVRPSDSR